jgi:catechol 2,3-dioxygenase-like lactoylglutathione lyase family enzyme
MQVSGAIPQLRTTDLERSIRFYTEALGLTLEFAIRDDQGHTLYFGERRQQA